MVQETTDNSTDWTVLGDVLALTVAAVVFHLGFVMKVSLEVSNHPMVAVAILSVFLVAFAFLVEAVSDLEVFVRGQMYAAVLAGVLLIIVVVVGLQGGLHTLGSYGVLSIAVIFLLAGSLRD